MVVKTSRDGPALIKALFTESCGVMTFLKIHNRAHALQALAAEYFFTLMFIFLATGTVTSGCHSADTVASSGSGGNTALKNVVPGSCFVGNTTSLLNIAFAFGFSIAVMVYGAASFSGGHLNPAVTLGFVITARISIPRAFLYMIFQCLGACTGSALVKAIDPSGFTAALGAANHLNTANDVIARQGWGTETLLTCFLVFIVFAATDAQRAVSTAHLPILAPLAIGLTVFLAHLVAIPIDGCSINPARSFGTSAVAHTWTNQWVFWVGPFSGAILAAAIYEGFFRDRTDASFDTPEDQGTEGEAPAGKVSLPAFSGMRGQQEMSAGMPDQNKGMAAPRLAHNDSASLDTVV